MNKTGLLLIILLGVKILSQTSNSFFSTSGPPYNFAREFIYHGTDLYMIDYQGEIFISADTGVTWRSFFRKEGITSFIINNQNEQFLTTYYHGILYSSNQGLSWEQRTLGLPTDVQYNHLFSSSDGRIFCATTKGLYISNNSGLNWSLFAHQGRNNTFTYVDHRGYIYCNAGGFYYSTNNGLSWSNYAGLFHKIQSGNDSILYRLSSDIIYKSSDGITWQKIWELDIQGIGILDMEYFPSNKILVSLSNGNNLILSTSGTVIDSFSISQNGSKILFEPLIYFKPAKKIISSTGYAIAISPDSVVDWSFYCNGLNKSNVVCVEYLDSLILAHNKNHGLFKFTFIDSKWTETNFQRNVLILQIKYDKSKFVYALSDSSLFKSNDYGITWERIIDKSWYLKFLKIEIHNVDTIIVFTTNNSLLFSSNKGLNWDVINLKPYPQSTVSEFISLTSKYFIILSDNKIFSSSDRGQSWYQVAINSIGFYKLYHFNTLLIATRFDDIYYSSDTARTWASSNTVFPIGTNIWNIISNSIGQFYLSSTTGIYRSLDSAENWQDYSLDIPNKEVPNIVFGYDGILYAGTKFDGLFRTLHSTTNLKEDNKFQPENFLLHQNFPNPFNPSTKIKFTIPPLTPSLSRGERVILKVYDILGREVATLVNEELSAGEYEVEFNMNAGLSTMNNELSTMNYKLSSHIYFYQLRVGNPSTSSGQVYIETKKMLLLK